MQKTHQFPLALLAVGPSAQAMTAQLQRNPPAGLVVLTDAADLASRVGRLGLLLLVIHPATAQDIAALTPLADQFGADGFGVHTLCIHLPADEQGELLLAHYGAWHILRPHIDAIAQVPSTTPEPLASWLPQAVGVMAQSLGDEAPISIDVKEMADMLSGGVSALWLSAQASGPDRATEVVQQLGQQLELCNVPPKQLHRAIVWVQGSAALLKLGETITVVKGLQERMAPQARMLFSSPYDESLEEVMRAWVLASSKPQER